MTDANDLYLDLGEIRGGFAHDYTARIVPVADTPIMRTIEKSTGVRRERSVTVEIVTGAGSRIIGLTCEDWHTELTPCVFTTPNRRVLGVRLQCCAYIANVDTDETQRLPIMPLMAAASDTKRPVMFLADYTNVHAFSGTDVLWVSDRVAHDGIMRLAYDDGMVHGLAEVGGGEVVPFTVDADTGSVRGGFRERFPDWPGSV